MSRLHAGRTFWLCKCDCGVECEVSYNNLKHSRRTQSCGCLKYERSGAHLITHGLYYTKEGQLWRAAKFRAKRDGVAFDLDIKEIKIPDYCPLLGIPINKNGGPRTPNSPSIDRIYSQDGYTKDNTWIVSFRANRIKNDASVEELEQIVQALKNKLASR